ncbi:MAG: oxidoreductase [Gammaproteobacteria bacterium]|jgi:aryl-alcohol dehydrogenase-like predicted oxidoreductase|nr:oxidoreductase [Gammaproteobacteria bacterium]
MSKRKPGKSGLEVAPVTFGGNVFGWTADESTSFKLIASATSVEQLSELTRGATLESSRDAVRVLDEASAPA